MALFRAIENTKPEKERLFHDPFAAAFLSKYYQTLVAACRLPLIRKLLSSYIQFRWPGTHTAAIARTKLIDDMITQAVREDGINQIFIINATYDTRAHRLNLGLPVHFVEIDHPLLQYRKRSKLEKVLPSRMIQVDYIKMDRHAEGFAAVMSPLLQDKSYKTLFLWERLTTSIEARESEAIFRYINTFPTDTQVIFTYVNKTIPDTPGPYPGLSPINQMLHHSRENVDSGLYPAALNAFMHTRNMNILYEGGADKYREQYFKEESRHMKGYEYFRVVRSRFK